MMSILALQWRSSEQIWYHVEYFKLKEIVKQYVWQGLADLSLKQGEDPGVELPSLSSEGTNIFISNKEGLQENPNE